MKMTLDEIMKIRHKNPDDNGGIFFNCSTLKFYKTRKRIGTLFGFPIEVSLPVDEWEEIEVVE